MQRQAHNNTPSTLVSSPGGVMVRVESRFFTASVDGDADAADDKVSACRLPLRRSYVSLQKKDLSVIRKKLSYDNEAVAAAAEASLLEDSDDMGGPAGCDDDDDDDDGDDEGNGEGRVALAASASTSAFVAELVEPVVATRGAVDGVVREATVVDVATITVASVAVAPVPYVSPHLNETRARVSLAPVLPSQQPEPFAAAAVVPDMRALLERAMLQSQAGRNARYAIFACEIASAADARAGRH